MVLYSLETGPPPSGQLNAGVEGDMSQGFWSGQGEFFFWTHFRVLISYASHIVYETRVKISLLIIFVRTAAYEIKGAVRRPRVLGRV